MMRSLFVALLLPSLAEVVAQTPPLCECATLPCVHDSRCASPDSDPFGGLGCNAEGKELCRFEIMDCGAETDSSDIKKPCFEDPSCQSSSLGCGALSHHHLRFCAFGEYSTVECPKVSPSITSEAGVPRDAEWSVRTHPVDSAVGAAARGAVNGACTRSDVMPAESGGAWTLTGCSSLNLSCVHNSTTSSAREPDCAGTLVKGDIEHLTAALRDSGQQLTTLELRGNWLGPSGGKKLSEALGGHPALVRLELGSCRLGDAGVAALSREFVKNPPARLEQLGLAHNSLSDPGVKEWAAILVDDAVPTLIEADLSWNGISQRGGRWLSAALGTNQALQSLRLDWNGLMDRGARALGEALATNVGLRVLSLEHNAIKNEGARALAQGLRTNGVLKNLSLGSNSISDAVMMEVSSALEALPEEPTSSDDVQGSRRESSDESGERRSTPPAAHPCVDSASGQDEGRLHHCSRPCLTRPNACGR